MDCFFFYKMYVMYVIYISTIYMYTDVFACAEPKIAWLNGKLPLQVAILNAWNSANATVPLAVESWDDPCSPSPQRPLFHSYGTVSRTLTWPYQTIWVERTSFWPWFLQSRDWFQEVKTYSNPRVLTFESRGVCNTVTFRLKQDT